MKKSELSRFTQLQKRAHTLNRTNQHRFNMIFQRHDKFTTIGLYDNKTKKYTISRDFEIDFSTTLNEIEEMLENFK